ncbi:MAG: vgb3 [Solirubrobacterales bacterium]|nr:vgb3 [Solirubrobacterales bacterium]
MSDLQLLLAHGTFFEGLRWRDGRWWASDFYADRVIAVDPDGTVEEVMHLPQPSGLGWLPDGTLLAVSMTGHAIVRRTAEGEALLHADLSPYSRGEANDMVVDAHGRAYVGNYGFDLMAGEDPQAATLIRVDPDGTVTAAAGGLHFPNGTLITPDGRTLIVAETIAARLTAFTIAADGSLSDRRVWAQLGPTPPLTTLDEVIPAVQFAPDGCTLDAEGCVWAADSLHHRCARIAPDGTILQEVTAPEDRVFYGCMLGGDDGRTLLLCCAPDWRRTRPEGELASELYTTRVSVPHAGLP